MFAFGPEIRLKVSLNHFTKDLWTGSVSSPHNILKEHFYDEDVHEPAGVSTNQHPCGTYPSSCWTCISLFLMHQWVSCGTVLKGWVNSSSVCCFQFTVGGFEWLLTCRLCSSYWEDILYFTNIIYVPYVLCSHVAKVWQLVVLLQSHNKHNFSFITDQMLKLTFIISNNLFSLTVH